MQRLASHGMAALLMVALIPLHLAAEATTDNPTPEVVLTAALQGQWIPIQEALDRGYQPDTKNPEGRTALMFAAFNGHTEVVDKLIQAGADVNVQDTTGSTPLMFASSGPFVETVALLLENGAHVNTTDNNEHFTALMWAATEGQVEVVKLLLEHGADTTLADIDGDTAESFAAKANRTEVVKVLQSAKSSTEESEEKIPAGDISDQQDTP